MSEGFDSIDSSSRQVSIKILRDAGVIQSLLLECVPLSVRTSSGLSVIAQVIKGTCMNIFLHEVTLVSELVSGFLVVGTPGPLYHFNVRLCHWEIIWWQGGC